MKWNTCPCLSLAVVLAFVSPPARGGEPAPKEKAAAEEKKAPAEKSGKKVDEATDDDGAFKVLNSESLGKIKPEQKAAEVVKAIGEPKKKGDAVHEEAIPQWVEEWMYPDLGMTLRMCSDEKKGPKTVTGITAGKGCTLATARGIKIGSTRAEVEKAYGDVQEKVPGEGPAKASDPQPARNAEEALEAKKTFVAGSIYGGVIFGFKEDKVDSIFIGAAAE